MKPWPALACAFACAIASACVGVQQRLPDDVLATIAQQPTRRLETDRFIIYYTAPHRPEVERFLARADRCASVLQAQAMLHEGSWSDKLVVVMPDVPFNNAFVLPELEGYEPLSVIPLQATLDFATEFGLPPDPGYIACHELTHYVHSQQVAGLWGTLDSILGYIYTPQVGYDPWFWEGLATHYETALSSSVGRPVWPIFTGMFAAGYAGEHVGGGDMSSLGRKADVGHHYLVGTMFMKFLTERYGERALWSAIAEQAHAWTGFFFTGTFKTGFGVSFGDLLDQFDAWHGKQYPERARPPAQRALGIVGNNARYGRGRDGTEAWVAEEVDLPPRLVVRDAAGATLVDTNLVEIVPPRTLVEADPLLVSGLSITADGHEVWVTIIDQGATFQVTRLLRWRRGETGVTEIASGLGAGATIDPAGRIYYYCAVDGDRWSLAAYDVASGAKRTVLAMTAGTYALGAQSSPDGKQLAVNVWDGRAFAAWIVDASTGAIVRRIEGDATPVYDASFTSDGRPMWLGVVDGRFQVFVDGAVASDAPYAVLGAREAKGTIRFLDREKWDWELAEVAVPAAGAPAPAATQVAAIEPATPEPLLPPSAVSAIASDEDYSVLDHFFVPQVRGPTLFSASSTTTMLGATLGGGDRLEMQRWSLAGYVDPNGADKQPHYGGSFAYLNTMLAPVAITATASAVDWADTVTTDDPKVDFVEQRRTRDASLAISRTWRDTFTAELGGVYTDDYVQLDTLPSARHHLGGPTVALAWESAESTRYTGTRRALVATAMAAYYPHAASTFAGDITDLGGSLGTTLPLPFGRRHTISASVRGRALVASEDTGLLQLGGVSPLTVLYDGTTNPDPSLAFDASRFPPNLLFQEPLRGYEDFAITTDRAAIGDLSWRYPIIIDRGVAATAWVLPASFVREFDLELFGAGAFDRAGDRHLAAGGAITLRIEFLRFPLKLQYQLARRFADDDAITQVVAIAPDL